MPGETAVPDPVAPLPATDDEGSEPVSAAPTLTAAAPTSGALGGPVVQGGAASEPAPSDVAAVEAEDSDPGATLDDLHGGGSVVPPGVPTTGEPSRQTHAPAATTQAQEDAAPAPELNGDRAAAWAATWGIAPTDTRDTVVEETDAEAGDLERSAARPVATSDDEDEHDGTASLVSRETQPMVPEAGGPPPDHAGGAAAPPPVHDPDGDMTTDVDLDPDEQRRAALVQSLPAVTDDTPLMAELQQDARRRIELRGRRFPRPAETRIVTVANQKGGVGKTTTTVNLAAALAQSGLNVLVLDNDPQGNASTALGVEHRAGTPSIYEVLVEGAPMSDAVQESADVPNLWCLPATIDLSGAEIELVSMVARETRLRSALDTYLQWRIDHGLERIDYVLVDCPPSLGLLTVNAFVVAREVLIPIQCEYYALEGLSQLLKTIQLIQAHLNRDLHVSTILLTMYDARTNLAQQVASEVRQHFPDRTLRTTVPRSVRISEAPSYGQTVMTYDAGSSGALAYLEAAREIAERGAASAPLTQSSSATAERGVEEDR